MKKHFQIAIAIAALGCSAFALTNSSNLKAAALEDQKLAIQPIKIWSAGSLKGALTDISSRFSQETGLKTEINFGPAGQLFSEIDQDHSPDIYLSADMNHPTTLAKKNIATTPFIFTHNNLCLITRTNFGLTPQNALAFLLKPTVKIGTSTPHNDPAGDYAQIFLKKLAALNPQNSDILQKRVQFIVGGKEKPVTPLNVNTVSYFLSSHKIDVFIGYCSRHEKTADPRFSVTNLPENLTVSASYGGTVLLNKNNLYQEAASLRFALYLMSEDAQNILHQYNFR